MTPLDVPVGWDDPPSVNLFHAILLLGGIPLLLFLAITVAVYVPSIIRGERIAPGQPAMEDQWMGGPRRQTAELTSAQGRTDTDTGGAGGRW